MNDLEKGRAKCMGKTSTDKTWRNFKDRFNEKWLKLCCLQGPTIKGTILLEQANISWNNVLQVIQTKRVTVMQEVQMSTEKSLHALAVSEQTATTASTITTFSGDYISTTKLANKMEETRL